MNNNERTLGVLPLAAFSVGTTLASGVFSLSGDFAASGASNAATLLGWLVCGVGMFGLCMAFFKLSIVKGDLTSGLANYARTGFGEYIGFNVAWGYWLSAILAIGAFVSLLFVSLSHFFSFLGEGTNLASFVIASLMIWIFALIVLQGVNEALVINVVVVIAKAIPIVVVILAILFSGAFSWETFTTKFSEVADGAGMFEQIKRTTFVTAWTFVGIEGAVVVSGRGKTTKISGQGIVLAFVTLLIMYMLISVLSMGVMTNEELAALDTPSLGGVLGSVVGGWGVKLVDIGVILSLVGALFTYAILNTDGCYGPAEQGLFPEIFTKRNKKGAPTWSVIAAVVLSQGLLVIMFLNDASFQACYALSTAGIMVPYAVSALYYLKVVIKGEDIGIEGAGSNFTRWLFAILGSVYGIWLLYSVGWVYWMILAILYTPGLIFYLKARKEQGKPYFDKTWERILAVAMVILCVVAIWLTAKGAVAWF